MQYYFGQVKEPLENWTLEFDLGNCARANSRCGPLDPVLRRVLDNDELVVYDVCCELRTSLMVLTSQYRYLHKLLARESVPCFNFFIVSSNVCSNACENCTSGYPVYCCQHFSYLHLILATTYISSR